MKFDANTPGALYDPVTKEYYKNIFIDKVPHRALGKVEHTKTSYFKNASSESYKKRIETTMSDSIKAKLDYKYAEAIEQMQIQAIAKEFEKAIGSLESFDIVVHSYKDVDRFMAQLSSLTQSGAGTNSIITAKINTFLANIDTIISKPKENGQQVYIRESSFDINAEEVIMSRNSELVRGMLENEPIKSKIQAVKDNTELTPAEKKSQIREIEDNLYTVGYRYPVPSKYNLGLYKIRLAEHMPKRKFTYIKDGKEVETEAIWKL